MDSKTNTSRLPVLFASGRALSLQLGSIFASRLVVSTSRRMVYTFAYAFSRGLGVPLTSITSLIALNQATGLLGPVFGFLGDYSGYKAIMMAGLGVLSAGLWLGGLLPGYVTLALALVLIGLAKALFDPNAQACVGEQIPYGRRGFAMGLLEMSWAGSTLIGVPLVGVLIERMGWQSSLLVMGVLGALCLIAVTLFVPGDGRHRRAQERSKNFAQVWRQMRGNRSVAWVLGFTFFICAANDVLFVVYGVWLESSFGLTLVALGAATMVIGVAEMLGEGLTALVSDRAGLGRALTVGMSATVLSYFLLFVIARTLPLALLGIFLVFLSFEFTIVTSFAHFTEILPGARGTMMSFNLAAGSLGRVTGALLGGGIWLAGGMPAISVSAGLVSVFALGCLVLALRRGGITQSG